MYPNTTELEPGTRVDFYNYGRYGNYGPNYKAWYSYGKGTVSEDGTQVFPDPGTKLKDFDGASFSMPPFATDTPPGKYTKDDAEEGDPVNLGSGLFTFSKTDISVRGLPGINLTRTYIPGDQSTVRPFGKDFTHPYDIRLWGASPYNHVDLILPDGSRVGYDRAAGTGDAGRWEPTGTPTGFQGSTLRSKWDDYELTFRDGTKWTFPYGSRVAQIEDRFGNTISIHRGPNHRVITSSSGRWLRLNYTAGRISSAEDSSGRIVTYTYDGNGRLWKVEDARGNITEHTYNTSGLLTSIKDGRGITFLTNVYDTTTKRVTKQTLADGTVYDFIYTTDPTTGNITRTEVTVDPVNDDRTFTRRVDFNAAGYRVADTRALGLPEERMISYDRDSGTHNVKDATDDLGRTTRVERNQHGQVLSITRLMGTPEAVTTSFTYEPEFGRISTVTDPLERVTTYDYDDTNHTVTVTRPGGRTTTTTLSAKGLPVSVVAPGNLETTMTYEGTDLTKVVAPGGATVRRHYDAAGRLAIQTDPLGNSTIYSYNPHDRVTSVTDPLGQVVSFAYDANENLTSVTDARNKVTSFTYDAMDRLETRTDPLLKTESFTYDGRNNLISATDRRGKVTEHTYDGLRQQVFTGFDKDGSTYASTIDYTYDAGGRMTSAVDSEAGTYTLDYDDLDRLTSGESPQGAVSYTYDDLGRRETMDVAGGAATSYEYFGDDAIKKITQGTEIVDFTYDPAGRLDTLTLPNGVSQDYDYDATSALESITYGDGTDVLGDLAYERDEVGRLVETSGSWARTTIPDAVGSASYDDANRLTAWDTDSFTYDDNGNMTSDGTSTFAFDARNELRSVDGPDEDAIFEYDPFGRRQKATFGSESTEYLYDGLNVIEEQEVGGTWVASSLTGVGVDAAYARTTPTTTEYRVTDALNSTVAQSDSGRATTTEYTYSPFGEASTTGSATDNPFAFSGREADATELLYLRARYYSAKLGRFISQDPIQFSSGDLNLYRYVGNQPTSLIDPLGLRECVYNFDGSLSCIEEAPEASMGGRKLSPEELEGIVDQAMDSASGEVGTSLAEAIGRTSLVVSGCAAGVAGAGSLVLYIPTPVGQGIGLGFACFLGGLAGDAAGD